MQLAASTSDATASRWQRLARNRLWDLGAGLVAVLAIVRLAVMLPARAYDYDFNHYYAASRMMLDGTDPYLNDLAPTFARYGFRYSPLIPRATNTPAFVWLFAPLVQLPPPLAFAIWTAMQVASLALILWLTRQILGARISRRGWRFFCAAVIASAPVFLHLGAGQMQLLLAAMMLGAFAAHRRGYDLTACLLVAGAGLLKLFPFVLLPWFVWRGKGGPGARLGRAALAAAVVAAVMIATGVEHWVNFRQHGLVIVAECGLQKSLRLEAFNQSLPSFVIDLASAAYGFTAPAAAAARWQQVGLGLGFAAILLAYFAVRKHRQESEEFALLTTVMVLGTAVAWAHYFVLLVFPVAVLTARVIAERTRQRIAGFAVLALVLADPGVLWQAPFWTRHHYPGILVTYVSFYGVCWLAAWFARESRRA